MNILLGAINNVVIYVVLGVMLVAMIVLPMLSNKKRQKQYQEMQNSLKPGTKIMTIGGLIGTICKVNEKSIELDIGTEDAPVVIVINKDAVNTNLDAQPAPVVRSKKSKKEEVATETTETTEVKEENTSSDVAVESKEEKVEEKKKETDEAATPIDEDNAI